MSKIFDKNLWQKHRDFAACNIGDSDFIFRYAVDDIVSNLELLDLKFRDILEIGSRFGMLSSSLIDLYPNASITATEISKEMIRKNISVKNVININDEELDFSENSFDLVVSCMNLHWMNDIQGFLKNIRFWLKKKGYLVLNFIASGSLDELKRYILDCEIKSGVGHVPHIIPLIQEDKVYMLFQNQGFDFIVVGRDQIELEYNNPVSLMRDIKRMGENSCIITDYKPLPRYIFSYDSSKAFFDKINLVTVVASEQNLLKEKSL
jgi:SAM-dependent methyltransferase